MKIIKNYGRSNAPRKTGTEENQRKLVISPKFTEPEGESIPHSIPKFAQTNPDITIAQWISVIDKIAAKPKGTKPPSLATYDFREKLGAVCWDIIKKQMPFAHYYENNNKEKVDHYEEIWAWKLHPYKGRNQNKFAKGRLSEIFHHSVTAQEAGKLSSEQYSKMAQKIKEHLYDNRLKMSGRSFNEKGLIELRATSIEKNTLANNFAKTFSPKTPGRKQTTTEQKYFGELPWKDTKNLFENKSFDLAQHIRGLCLKQIEQQEENQKKKKYKNIHISYDEIISTIKKHYGEVLGADSKMCDLRKDPEKESIVQLYGAIKDYYKQLICGKKKIRNVKLLLPKNDQKLLDVLEKKQKNRAINELVRLGRVLYYQASSYCKTDETGNRITVHEDSNPIWSIDKPLLARSRYFSSAGQADIKSSEAFVRVWRGAVTMANRSFTNLTKINSGDVLGSKGIIKNVLDDGNFEADFKLYFGGSADLLQGPLSNQELAAALLRDAMTIRNDTFHFRDLDSFAQTLKEKLTCRLLQNETSLPPYYKDFSKQAQDVLKKDTETWQKRNYFALKAAKLDRFIPKESFEAFLDIAQVDLKDYTFNFTLPKFSSLLERYKNISKSTKKQKTITLPEPPNQREFQAKPALLAKYTAYKILYEEAFLAWLSERCRYCLNEFAEKAIKRTSDAAQDINAQKLNKKHKDLITAQASKLPKFEDGETLTHLTAKLTAATASEMRVQKGYSSDSENAREQANWINNFKMDFILEALDHFLKENKAILALISKLNTENKSEGIGYEIEQAPKETCSLPDWASKLYIFLHFIPVSECNLVYQQFLKWGALQSKHDLKGKHENEQKKEANTELVNTIKQVFVLYCKMHDDVYSGNLGEESKDQRFEFDYRLYEDFYETPEHIKDVLNLDREDTNKTPSNVIRGLREIARFGELELLKKIRKSADIAKITQEDIRKAKTNKDIELAHETLKKLRKKKEKGSKNNEWRDKDVTNYRNSVHQISAHREAKAITTLHDYIVVHNILNALFARMADYAGLWERDHFFIQLAVIWLDGKKPGEVIESSFTCNFTRNNPARNNELKEGEIKDCLNALGVNIPFTKSNIRNAFAHFNYLRDRKNGKKDINNAKRKNFTSLVDDLRDLMSYDRKLKNSVTKSLQDILAREGFTLSWDMDTRHQLQLHSQNAGASRNNWLKVDKIHHLKKGVEFEKDAKPKPPITEDRHTKRAEQLLRTALSKKLYT